jgi:hypothetical protein
MKEIKLSQGKVALVDDDDYAWLSQWNWHYALGYARSNIMQPDGRRQSVFMHRKILEPPDHLVTDHVNRNGLDNRRSNLRSVTHAENMLNCGARKTSSSKYKGVSFRAAAGKWVAQIQFNKKLIFLGFFDSESDAAKCYDVYAVKLHGEFAYTNFTG